MKARDVMVSAATSGQGCLTYRDRVGRALRRSVLGEIGVKAGKAFCLGFAVARHLEKIGIYAFTDTASDASFLIDYYRHMILQKIF
jgi:hypothetical protein